MGYTIEDSQTIRFNTNTIEFFFIENTIELNVNVVAQACMTTSILGQILLKNIRLLLELIWKISILIGGSINILTC
jgi:hypothetical protein